MPDTPRILVVSAGARSPDGPEPLDLLGRRFLVETVACDGDTAAARRAVREAGDGVAAIALDGFSPHLELGCRTALHPGLATLLDQPAGIRVVDGQGVRPALERWGVALAASAQPGIFARASVLMVPGLGHGGAAQALSRHARRMRFADPAIFFGLPELLGIGSARTLAAATSATLARLREADPLLIERGRDEAVRARSLVRAFRRADLLAGSAAMILRFGPRDLSGKTIVVDHLRPDQLEALVRRRADRVVTLLPGLAGDGPAGHPSAVIEALLAAVCVERGLEPDEDAYLDLLADLDWRPAIRELKPGRSGVHRFAFVIHPLRVEQIHRHPLFRWTRVLPDGVVERVAARMPPIYLGRIRGARSPATGQAIEGLLYSLGATPRMMMRMGERPTYRRLIRVARLAERRGARIMGLGAFTSVVGDAGITVDREVDIAVTSGNSLTVAATLEAAKTAVRMMGTADLSRGRAMVVGATGSIGAVCARLLAQAVRDVVLVSIEPERLIALKRRILAETPGARVTIATSTTRHLGGCDLVVSATSAFGQRVIDIARARPGAVICDVARPPDIGRAEAAVRPDVLVIESGEVIIPGDVDFGWDIDLPPRTAYACLAETALLAMEGRFESFTLGRELSTERVKEIFRLFRRHGFRIAPLRSFGEPVTDGMIAEKRRLAARLRADPELFERTCREAADRLAQIPVSAKGVRAARRWDPMTLASRVFESLGRRLERRRRARA
ncbi:MAG: serine carboxypeptidase [Acidobacteria bacterium]|nr:MAG: serine carboxypeptidase [Acidobacteriota bacterium]